MRKIRKKDDVIIIAGRDRGKRGSVLIVIDDYLVIEGVNMVSKHIKGNPQKNIAGKIERKESKIHRSKVALYNPTTGKADRVYSKFLEDGRKVRVFRSTAEVVDT